jgi:hypothetical protein
MTVAFKICADHAFARTICEDRHILRSTNEDEGSRSDLTILNAPPRYFHRPSLPRNS